MANKQGSGRPAATQSAERLERLAAQLRENLKKRKQQSRLRDTRGDKKEPR